MRLIVLVLFFLIPSCTLHKGVDKWSTTNIKANRIARKFNYSQPHKSYSDKSTWKRTLRVAGHGYHRTY